MRILLLFAVVFLVSCASVVPEKTSKEERTIKTFVGLKQKNVVMQRYDFSCGISSLLTLFRYHFGDDYLNERKVLTDFLSSLSEEKKKETLEKGLSVLDLKTLSEGFGYSVYVVELKKESLLKIDRPILVYLETPEYKHFSVLRGVKDRSVFLADSSYGNTRMSIPAFLQMWKGNIAVFLDKAKKNIGRLEIFDEELNKPEIRLLQTIL